MNETIVMVLFGAVVIGIAAFKIRQVVAENRVKRAERNLDAHWAGLMETSISPGSKAALLKMPFWTIWERTNPPQILSVGFRVPKSVPSTPSAPHEMIEHPPAIICFSSRQGLQRFLNSTLGRLIARQCDYRSAIGHVIFEEALRQQVPVKLNPEGEIQKHFSLDEITEMLQVQDNSSKIDP